MAELLIRNNFIGFIKAIIFDKDGTLLNSEEFLLELAITRINFAVSKFRKLNINNVKIILLKKLLNSVYGLKESVLNANASLAIASREHNIISTATIFTLFGLDWFTSLSLSEEIFDEVDIFLFNNRANIQNHRTLISGALDLLLSLKKKGYLLR